MKTIGLLKVMAFAAALFAAAVAFAGPRTARAETPEERISRLEATLDAALKELAELKEKQAASERTDEGVFEEIRELKLQQGAAPEEYRSYSGLGPAASKVYYSKEGVSVGGYGETVFNARQGRQGDKDSADSLRFILYAGYKFTDRIVMNTELEFEHAGFEKGATTEPEVFTEFSYLDFLYKPTFNVRAGLMLVPVGLTNEYHEPTLFRSVNRPEVETNVIPSTWRDIGVMAYGKTENGFRYKYARVNGMNGSKFRAKDWVRDGRYKGSKAGAEDFADVVSLGYERGGLDAGVSWHRGGVGQGAIPHGRMELTEGHITYRKDGLEFRALAASGELKGDAAFEAQMNLQKAGKRAGGWYAELAYDTAPLLLGAETAASLYPFARFSEYDTNKSAFPGANARDPKYDRSVTTVGLNYLPHPNVSLKFDYEMKDSEDAGSANKTNQFNLGVGFLF